MKINKINQKQLRLERERQLAQKKKEFEAEYYEELKEWKKTIWEESFPFESLERYLERKCKKWLEGQRNIPSGKYADWRKITAEYQKKFIQYTCKLCPDIFEELRQSVSLFDELFGESKERYNAIFNSFSREIFELESSLSSEIRYCLMKDNILEFRPYKSNNYDYSFRWGEYRLLFYLLAFKLVSPDDSDRVKELRNEIFELIRKDLNLREDLNREGIEPEIVERFIDLNCQNIIEYLLGDNCKFFFEQANSSINRFLNYLFSENEQNYYSKETTQPIEPFIKLQYNLIKWASRHHLGKDWILRYAYYFLSKFSENPNLNISEIEIHSLSIRSLAAYPFEFKFNGWLAGDETKENYEKRLTESFEDELSKYFDGVFNYFELNKKKRLTKPKSYDRVKWLVRWTIQGWSKSEILAEIYDEVNIKGNDKYPDDTLLIKAFKDFKKYDLPVRA